MPAAGTEKYPKIVVPILAIFALPHDLGRQARAPTTRRYIGASTDCQDAWLSVESEGRREIAIGLGGRV